MSSRDLLLAMAAETIARRVFKNGELCFEDFENDFRGSLPRLAAAESRGMG
jgi:hypothetical protein